ncbi:hypothetical protein [Massilia sp. S19_KUP03_FR1]|uniref:hypothetical protein n=1 Tax=Massilia sp. S19_KUP03_FR1 TaxID=3025503 RepID=UPI002FCCF256
MANTFTSADLKIELKDMHPVVTRTISFADGSTMSFTLHLPRDDEVTLPGLHRKSIENAIERLQDFLKPQSASPAKAP